jgi:response regulator RpfG family c-di-GMP phosphodiesterase
MEAGKQFDPAVVEAFKGLEVKFAEIREKMGDE